MSGPPNCRCYYSCNNYPNTYEDISVTRWDEGPWDVTLETFLTSSQRDNIFGNIVPNAYRELYNILGTPSFIDTTYSSGNTLIFELQGGYGLSSLREKRTVAVKNATDTFLVPDRFSVKLECIRLDT